ncbi:uncharacterized protein LOC120113726 [Hibiscus syriacus]|uniref:uncharacterized protein LOC120113726 n=1 Tax=Hibiscus syriacus TaxID=106335 RepID=UPI001922995E|nr:uncharacterized protein LOC120113726 [Hibiscus syriacus]
MDPLKQFPSTEEFSNIESGWTRYLAFSSVEDDFRWREDNIKDDDGEEASDDSTVSDASSAPSRHRYEHKDDQGKGSQGHGHANLKHDKGDYSSCKEVKKEVERGAKNSGEPKQRLRSRPKHQAEKVWKHHK